jgi:biotin carboxyl carrier protein
MKKFSFKIQGNKYEVEVESQDSNLIVLEINGSQYNVELEQEIKVKKTPTLVRSNVATHKEIKNKPSSGVFKVVCPLPGNIMNVMVKVGDVVKVGDKLMMYEAMKMENLIQAEKAGKISKINVKIGDAVLQEDVMMEISI